MADACTFHDCTAPATAKGLCAGHYQQRRRRKKLTALVAKHKGRNILLTVRVNPETKEQLDALASESGKSSYETATSIFAQAIGSNRTQT